MWDSTLHFWVGFFCKAHGKIQIGDNLSRHFQSPYYLIPYKDSQTVNTIDSNNGYISVGVRDQNRQSVGRRVQSPLDYQCWYYLSRTTTFTFLQPGHYFDTWIQLVSETESFHIILNETQASLRITFPQKLFALNITASNQKTDLTRKWVSYILRSGNLAIYGGEEAVLPLFRFVWYFAVWFNK